VAVDATDDRFAQLSHEDEQVDEEVAAAELVEAAHLAVKARQVGPGAKDAAGAGQHHDADLGLLLAPPESGCQVAQHGRREGVALVRPVEGDGGDVPGRAEQHLLQGRNLGHAVNRRSPSGPSRNAPGAASPGKRGRKQPRIWPQATKSRLAGMR
jgi:hypothetical protein